MQNTTFTSILAHCIAEMADDHSEQSSQIGKRKNSGWGGARSNAGRKRKLLPTTSTSARAISPVLPPPSTRFQSTAQPSVTPVPFFTVGTRNHIVPAAGASAGSISGSSLEPNSTLNPTENGKFIFTSTFKHY